VSGSSCLPTTTKSNLMPQSGFGYSSQPATSPRATSTSDPSSKCNPTTCADTLNATSSPVSADGHSPCGSPDGPMTDLFGRALAPASRSAPQASSVAATMSATYGLRSSASSASVALGQSLANRLQERLASRGSTMFALTWKAKVTPQRRQICQLQALAPPMGVRGCGGWPTPVKEDARSSARHGYMITGNRGTTLTDAARMAAWATPTTRDYKGANSAAHVNRKSGGAHGPACEPGSSPWADLEWLACSDGKARPTQPGLFPLAHGVPARVGRLRAYGNAIVPQVAAEFIGAMMEMKP
jgi:hypothetical protein